MLFLSIAGSLKFNCQHGETECEANIIHCCSIEAIHDTATRLNMVACMITDNSNPTEAFQRVSLAAVGPIDAVGDFCNLFLVFETIFH